MPLRSSFRNHPRLAGLIGGLIGCSATLLAVAQQPPAAVPTPINPGSLLNVTAAGSAARPPSLTAVTQGSAVVIDTVQALHPAAEPRFKSISIAMPGSVAADALLGWNSATGQLVTAPLQPTVPATPAVSANVLKIRYASRLNELFIDPEDQVVVVSTNGIIDLPDLARGRVEEGQVVVIKALAGVTRLAVAGLEGSSRQMLGAGKSLKVVAATRMDPPRWLVIQ